MLQQIHTCDHCGIEIRKPRGYGLPHGWIELAYGWHYCPEHRDKAPKDTAGLKRSAIKGAGCAKKKS